MSDMILPAWSPVSRRGQSRRGIRRDSAQQEEHGAEHERDQHEHNELSEIAGTVADRRECCGDRDADERTEEGLVQRIVEAYASKGEKGEHHRPRGHEPANRPRSIPSLVLTSKPKSKTGSTIALRRA